MKQLLTLITFGIILLVTNQLAAQSCNNVLYLKNGSIIKGTLIEVIPDSTVKIQTADGSLFVYNINEVDKITSAVTVTGHPTPKQNNGFELKRKGFVGSFEMGAVTFGKDASVLVSGHIFAGYLFNPTISLSLGSGVEVGDGLAMIPFFLDFRTYFLNKRNTPYMSFAGGYAIYGNDFERIDEGGVMAEVLLGGRFMMKRNLGMNVSAGYRLQGFQYGGALHGFTGKVGIVF